MMNRWLGDYTSIASIATPGMWLAFALAVVILLVIDFGVLHRRGRTPTWPEALGYTLGTALIALAFGYGIYSQCGKTPAVQFVTGYIIEQALSIDNLFVFMLIFKHFAIAEPSQHRVLFWGVFGALVMRATFIAMGIALVHTFAWLFYVMGIFLLITSVKLLWPTRQEANIKPNLLLQAYNRWIPHTTKLHGAHFFAYEYGRWVATPLFLVLLVVEASDIVFAFDSIPAIFSITTDIFLVYTSNVFAIMGLRSLYFLLLGALNNFRLLNVGLAAVLGFIGLKMLLHDFYQISAPKSLAVIAILLGFSMALSVMTPSLKK